MCVQNRGAVEGVGGVCSHRVSTIDGTAQKPAIVVPVQYTQRESLVNLLGRGREEERWGRCSFFTTIYRISKLKAEIRQILSKYGYFEKSKILFGHKSSEGHIMSKWS